MNDLELDVTNCKCVECGDTLEVWEIEDGWLCIICADQSNMSDLYATVRT